MALNLFLHRMYGKTFGTIVATEWPYKLIAFVAPVTAIQGTRHFATDCHTFH